jgi:hypothetical protein
VLLSLTFDIIWLADTFHRGDGQPVHGAYWGQASVDGVVTGK